MTGQAEVHQLLTIIAQSAAEALDEYENHGGAIPSIYSTSELPWDGLDASLKLKKSIRALEGACDQLCATLAPPLHTIINRAQDRYWSCLRVAALGRFADVLVGQPDGMNIDTLATKVKIPTHKLLVIMRTLAARHCFQEVTPHVFANTRLSLVMQSRSSAVAFVDLLTQEGQQAALHLQQYLGNYTESQDLTNTVFGYANGATGFEGSLYAWLKDRTDRLKVMNAGMSSMNLAMGTILILEVYPWQKYSTVCDVGCGQGSFAWPLLNKFAEIKITLFDLPETLEMAKQHSMNDQDLNRISFAAGNFFKSLLPQGLDVYYLRNIIHNWPDKEAIAILKAVHHAMGIKSRLLIHDYSIYSADALTSDKDKLKAPEPMLPDFGYGNTRLHQQDLTMMLMYNSQERTSSEVQALGRAVGLALHAAWDLGETVVLEFICA